MNSGVTERDACKRQASAMVLALAPGPSSASRLATACTPHMESVSVLASQPVTVTSPLFAVTVNWRGGRVKHFYARKRERRRAADALCLHGHRDKRRLACRHRARARHRPDQGRRFAACRSCSLPRSPPPWSAAPALRHAYEKCRGRWAVVRRAARDVSDLDEARVEYQIGLRAHDGDRRVLSDFNREVRSLVDRLSSRKHAQRRIRRGAWPRRERGYGQEHGQNEQESDQGLPPCCSQKMHAVRNISAGP